jgi:hypothetical protein
MRPCSPGSAKPALSPGRSRREPWKRPTLYLYSNNPEHDLRGGLLLRCDLHALFDRWLITIDPDTWAIQIAPELKRYPGLAELGGKAVQLPEDLRPRLKYIQEHAALARASWA